MHSKRSIMSLRIFIIISPQTDELEVKKAEIQSSVTVIKNKAEYEKVKQDLREYEKACMIHRRNLKYNEERENDLGRIRKY